MNTNIHISGLKLLTNEEKDLANKILNKFYNKIQRHFKNEVSIECHIKEYEKEGKRKKFSVHIRIHGDRIFEADYADWDFSVTLHKVTEKLMNEIEKNFK